MHDACLGFRPATAPKTLPAPDSGACPRRSPVVDLSGVHRSHPGHDIQVLKARTDLAELAGRYVALKRRRPGEWWACCPFHRDRTPSFKIDAGRQRFHCFGCGAGGDAIDFLARIEGLDTAGAIQRLKEAAGGSPRQPHAPSPLSEPETAARHNRELAQEVWRQSEPITDELALRYLAERRGLTRWDHDRLRWHPQCPWKGGRAGCILAPISDHATGHVVGIWRIRPALEGSVERRGLGPARGNAARLFAAVGPQIVIAEGVEDALAAHELTDLPAWAALSAGNMRGLILPARFTEVLILADNDEPDHNGERLGLEAARGLARRLQAEGRRAIVRRPVALKDANDVLRAGRAA